ncbi:hypothetical protein D3C77_341760 [compost metagenome]
MDVSQLISLIPRLLQLLRQIVLDPLRQRNLLCRRSHESKLVGAVFLPGARFHTGEILSRGECLLQLLHHLESLHFIAVPSLNRYPRCIFDAVSYIETVYPGFQHISGRSAGHAAVIIRSHGMDRKAQRQTLRFTRLELLRLAECSQRSGRLAQLALRSFIIDLDNLFACVDASRIRYGYADFRIRFPFADSDLRFLRLNTEFRVRQAVSKFELHFIRAERLEITIPDINVFLIYVLEFVTVISSRRIVSDGISNGIG